MAKVNSAALAAKNQSLDALRALNEGINDVSFTDSGYEFKLSNINYGAFVSSEQVASAIKDDGRMFVCYFLPCDVMDNNGTLNYPMLREVTILKTETTKKATLRGFVSHAKDSELLTTYYQAAEAELGHKVADRMDEAIEDFASACDHKTGDIVKKAMLGAGQFKVTWVKAKRAIPVILAVIEDDEVTIASNPFHLLVEIKGEKSKKFTPFNSIMTDVLFAAAQHLPQNICFTSFEASGSVIELEGAETDYPNLKFRYEPTLPAAKEVLELPEDWKMPTSEFITHGEKIQDMESKVNVLIPHHLLFTATTEPKYSDYSVTGKDREKMEEEFKASLQPLPEIYAEFGRQFEAQDDARQQAPAQKIAPAPVSTDLKAKLAAKFGKK